MSETPASSSRTQKRSVKPFQPRTMGGAVGGLLAALSMSVAAAVLLTAAVTPVVAVTGQAASAAVDLFENLPEYIDPGQLAQPSTLWATRDDGTHEKIASFFVQDRVPAAWDEISQYAKDAVVAVEDAGFYAHGGVNVVSAARAAVQNAFDSEGPGASTVTMQYVRNILVQEAEAILDENERNAAWTDAMRRDVDRKLKEMRLAIGIEKKFTKDEIMLGYLNIALFGRNVYGIESAANYYFNTSAKDLTLAQAASLIAIVNSPTVYQIDIPENIPANLERRNFILSEMLRHGKITQAQHDEAVATPVEPVITPKQSGCRQATDFHGLGHFCNFVQMTIRNDPSFGDTPAERMHNFSRGGFDIYTSIDLDLQEAANTAMTELIAPQWPGFNAGGAAVTTEVGTSRVLAMVQNRPFSDNPVEIEENTNMTAINYNTDQDYGGSNGFQVGSTFKAFTLANWIKQGRSLQETVNANGGRTVANSSIKAHCLPGGVYAPTGTFKFDNHNGIQYGTRSVLYGMAFSANGAFVSMLEKTDLCDVIDLAESLNVHRASPQQDETLPNYGTNKLTLVPSNPFAGIDQTAPITMSMAYGAFAGDGTVCTAAPIDRIFDPQGNEVPFTKATCHQPLEPAVAAGVAHSLQYNVTNGIAGHARSQYGIPHIAKTGTTDGWKDHWTVGGSTKAITAMWTGNVTGDYWTERTGIIEAGDTVFGRIVNAVDAKFGGNPFPTPDTKALRVTTKAVPSVAGKSFDEAKNTLTALGFTVRDGGDTDSSQAAGTVARTEPAGQAPENSDITIYRSNGQLKRIPESVVGAQASAAVSTLQGAGFTSITLTCESGGTPANGDRVASSAPDAGSELRPGERVTLTVACASGDD